MCPSLEDRGEVSPKFWHLLCPDAHSPVGPNLLTFFPATFQFLDHPKSTQCLKLELFLLPHAWGLGSVSRQETLLRQQQEALCQHHRRDCNMVRTKGQDHLIPSPFWKRLCLC